MTPYWTCTHEGRGLPCCPKCDRRMTHCTPGSEIANVRDCLAEAAREIARLSSVLAAHERLCARLTDEVEGWRAIRPDLGPEIQVGGDPPPPRLGMRYRDAWGEAMLVLCPSGDRGWPSTTVWEVRDEHDRVLWRRE